MTLPSKPYMTTAACFGLITLALMFSVTPRVALAIPVLANGQGVTCAQCHSAPPNLNAYGRYIMATNLSKALDAHAQMRENQRDPISLIVAGDGTSVADPGMAKTVLGLLQLNSAGYLGPKVTYYASVPIVDGGFPAAGLDQLWFAYNGLSHGNGSLQVGDFPTPVLSPWLSQSLSLSGYALAGMPVGMNAVGVGDNRWGASYTQIGPKGLIANVAYMTNSGPLEYLYDSNPNSPTAASEGQSYAVSLEEMNVKSHFTGGVAALGGTYPLPSGAKDSFRRTMALLSYSTSPTYAVNAMALVGNDSNPIDDGTTTSGSNGWSIEGISTPVSWLHLDARYERTNDGLGTIQSNYVGDIAFSIVPNLILTLENVSSVGTTPVASYQLLWAGPFVARHAAKPAIGAVPASTAVAVASSEAVAVSPQSSAIGKQLFAANCAACHGANGEGGAGPNLHGIATRKSLADTIAFIENPSGAMPKLYPDTLSATQVQEVATYIRTSFR